MTIKNELPVTIGILIMGSNFKNLFLMVVICWCCALRLAILLLSPLKVLIIAVLFMTLANMMQFICWKTMCLMIADIYKMHFTDINVKNRDYSYYFDTVSLKQKYRSKKSMRKLIKNEINEKKLD